VGKYFGRVSLGSGWRKCAAELAAHCGVRTDTLLLCRTYSRCR